MSVHVDVDTPASLQHQRSKEELRHDGSYGAVTVTNPPAPAASEAAKISVETCDETKTICFSWQMSNLKSIFDASRGEGKSK